MTPTPNSPVTAALPWRPGAVRLLLGILIYGLIVVAAGVAQLAAAPGRIPSVGANDPAFEGLLFRTDDANRYLPAPLIGTEITVDVSGPIARTRVKQYFLNPTKHWLEGIYVFPLADTSAVDRLKMRIGDRVIEGVIKARDEARAIYEKARAAGRRTALLEGQRPNIFTTSVANIGPGQAIVIEIAYQQVVPFRDGKFRLRVPLVVGPRYIPGQPNGPLTVNQPVPPSPQVPDAGRISPPVLPPDQGAINPVALTVRIAGAAPGTGFASPHHAIAVTRDDAATLVRLRRGPVPADRDFELTWSPAGAATRATLYRETWRGAGYGLVMIVPPADLGPDRPRLDRDIVFVIDTSGSMAGRSIDQARASLQYALARLAPGDRFNIIQFNSKVDALFGSARPASAPNLAVARDYVAGLQSHGGTEMRPAVMAALDGATVPGRLRQVVFVTDGAVGNEAELFQLIADRTGDQRLFTVGIGSAPNQHFMRGAALQGRGTFTFIGSPDQVTARMAELWRKLSAPVLTDIRVEIPGAEAWPNPIPDLFAGEPLVVAFRLAGPAERIVIRGRGPAGDWTATLDPAKAVPGRGLAKLWARRKIAGLEARAFQGLSRTEVDRAVTEVALGHELVTRLTSLVAVDKTPARPEGSPLESRPMAINLPFGWDYDKVFGQPRLNEVMVRSAGRMLETADVELRTLPAPARQAVRTLPLPQTATSADLYLALGGLVILGTLLLFGLGVLRRRRAGV